MKKKENNEPAREMEQGGRMWKGKMQWEMEWK